MTIRFRGRRLIALNCWLFVFFPACGHTVIASINAVSVGDTREEFWGQLRRNGPEVDAFKRFDQLEALLTISKLYKRAAGDGTRWQLGLDGSCRSGICLRVQKDGVPILDQPQISSKDLGVVGLTKAGDFLSVIKTEKHFGGITNPVLVSPSEYGVWCNVRTKYGEGWLLAETYGNETIAVSLEPPTVKDSRPTAANRPSMPYAAILFGVIVLIAFIVATALSSGSSARRGSESSGESSYGSVDRLRRSSLSPHQRLTGASGDRSDVRINALGVRYIDHADESQSFWGKTALGVTYCEYDDGSRSYRRETALGVKYYEHEDGSRSYERTSALGKEYLEHPDGSRSYKKESALGKEYWEHERWNHED